ncbi:hypothetical protein ACFYO2_20940 [Streptomyces sp. NPDC006602]
MFVIILRAYDDLWIVSEEGALPWSNPEQVPCKGRELSGEAP